MEDTKWTLEQWKEAVGDSPNWEIFAIPEEIIQKYGFEQDYSIKYVGPLENGTTVEEVPKVPLLYRTFADLKDLIELPLGLQRGLNYDIVAGCSNFNPSSDALQKLTPRAFCGHYTTNFLNDTGSPNIIDHNKLCGKPSDLVASLLGLDPSEVHKVLTEAYGENFDRYNSHNLHSVSDMNNFMRSINLLKALDCFIDTFPHFTVKKFSTGVTLTLQEVSKASDMKCSVCSVYDRIAICSDYFPASPLNFDCIIYHLSDDFVLDTDCENLVNALFSLFQMTSFLGTDGKKLVNALGIKFNNTHLKHSYKAGKDAIVEVTGDNSIVATGCPLQASGTLTIKGSGTLTLECSEGMQACIGTETHTGMSYGRWEPGREPSLNKIIVDGVKVDCHSRVLNFSIGSYGEPAVPEIECINGGSLNCPEINGKRIMNRSGAEGLCGSTKRENCAEYEIVTDVHDKPQKMLF